MSKPEPGSASVAVAKQALAQKRNVNNLNTRLQMYVRAQQEKDKTINQLKEAVARNEMEYRAKMKQQQIQHQEQTQKSSKEIQNLVYQNKCVHQELDSAQSAKQEFEQRYINSESRNAALTSECENLKAEITRIHSELDGLRKNYAEIKYKYDSYEMERSSFDDKMAKFKIKNEKLLKELTQKETNLKSEKETFQRVIMEKNDEIDNLKNQVKDLEIENNTKQTRLRKEFDGKIAEFIRNREEQYKQEKNEWMRIFKEEFNRKLRTFKEANQQLSHSNIKQSEENTELRARISKLKQQKMELEVTNRNNEEENEKLRTDLDHIRHEKEEEIKNLNTLVLQQRDQYKAKELQFDELAGIKLQLDQEIELYRNILNEAEQASGYISPLSHSNTNNGARHSRKRKRVCLQMTPMGMTPVSESTTTSNIKMSENDGHKVETPGIGRAAKNAQHDIKHALQSDGSMVVEEEEMKDIESDNDCGGDNDHDMDGDHDQYTTPGNLEGARLQFSGLDLLKGMIEIQNFHEQPICLNGYTLSNQDGSAQYDLPKDMVLARNERLRIYCGQDLYKQICEGHGDDDDDERLKEELIGDYDGAYVCWGRNVWTGLADDCARLYNPTQDEIARMEISPDMVDMDGKSKGGCFIM